MSDQQIDIAICMGSSCYSRGNNRNLEAIRNHLAHKGVEARIVGHLCQDQCRNGPNLVVTGRQFGHLDAATVVSILRDPPK